MSRISPKRATTLINTGELVYFSQLNSDVFQPVRGASHIFRRGGEDAERVPLHHGGAHGGGAAGGVEGGEKESGERGE